MFNRSFDPTEYNKNRVMDFVAMTQDKFSMLQDYTDVVTLSIA